MKKTKTADTSQHSFSNTSAPFCFYQGVLGSEPSLILQYKNKTLTITHAEQSFSLACDAKGALEFLSDLRANLPTPDCLKSISPKTPFKYGFMGFFSFEFGLKLLDLSPKHQSDLPDFYFILPTKYEILDSQLNLVHSYKNNSETRVFELPDPDLKIIPTQKNFTSNLSKKEYNQKLVRIKKHLLNGETYQVNFAQEWTGTSSQSALNLFKQLHNLNCSPHEAILHTANFSLISNSPECLFKKNKNILSTYPIKGTSARSSDKKQDSQNRKNLLASLKDQAELEMIVDLARNDLAKISKPGTVKVKKHRYTESYNNVHHTLSQVDCHLKPSTTFADIIQALFPGGSVTGCPKHRTCQIIQNLEKSARGAYCGSLGYLDINGDCCFNILIRTITQIGNSTSFHSGGGITINSIDTSEYTETLIKAQNLLNVLTTSP